MVDDIILLCIFGVSVWGWTNGICSLFGIYGKSPDIPLIKRRISSLRTASAVTPLLGLLGTISGLVQVFGIIAGTGSVEPAYLSEGISTALITTQAGLVTAIPAYLAARILDRRAERRGLSLAKV
ncbi:MotA/TolQ/ExbB proton channel family protein [Limisalsivibrio acetivorans]|uniref:MotA/TolQ/ExbB proton channel family protein n=1 Tax=Limisalsivibrio acetivorans TaxID=1304888 RepID=UPI0003B35380|nr:MotA/TolQ/ExbB proton channel family protein [Limisalsivibrio acetivorans]